MPSSIDPQAEWLEADGLGGFASGTVSGIRTRRYHALLLTAATPPAGRMVLVNGFDAWVRTSGGILPISSQRYQPDVIHPDGAARLREFEREPWPRWTYWMEEGMLVVQQEIFVPRGASVAVMRWSVIGNGPASLLVRPFLSGRDFHATHHENGVFNFAAEIAGDRVTWSLYPGVLRVTARSNGQYMSQPDWYRNFSYSEEQARGLDFTEDLAAPGLFEFDLGAGRAELMLVAEGHEAVFSRVSMNWPTANAFGDCSFPRNCTRPPIAILFGEEPEKHLLQGIRGLATGDVTLSSPYGDYALQQDASRTPGRSSLSGRAQYPKGCCPIDFRIKEKLLSSTRWTLHCGM